MRPVSPFKQFIEGQQKAQLHVECQLELASSNEPPELLDQRKTLAGQPESDIGICMHVEWNALVNIHITGGCVHVLIITVIYRCIGALSEADMYTILASQLVGDVACRTLQPVTWVELVLYVRTLHHNQQNCLCLFACSCSQTSRQYHMHDTIIGP